MWKHPPLLQGSKIASGEFKIRGGRRQPRSKAAIQGSVVRADDIAMTTVDLPKTKAQILSVTCTTGLLPSSSRLKVGAAAVCPNLGLSVALPGLRTAETGALPLSGSTVAVAALSHFHIGCRD